MWKKVLEHRAHTQLSPATVDGGLCHNKFKGCCRLHRRARAKVVDSPAGTSTVLTSTTELAGVWTPVFVPHTSLWLYSFFLLLSAYQLFLLVWWHPVTILVIVTNVRGSGEGFHLNSSRTWVSQEQEAGQSPRGGAQVDSLNVVFTATNKPTGSIFNVNLEQLYH